eukprot:gene9407-1652_t
MDYWPLQMNQPPGKESFDEYGFLQNDSDDQNEEGDFRCHNYGDETEKQIRDRYLRWQSVLRDWSKTQKKDPNLICNMIKEGVPNSLRGQIWKALLDVEQVRKSSKLSYPEEAKRIEAWCKEHNDEKNEHDERNRSCTAVDRRLPNGELCPKLPRHNGTDEYPCINAINQIKLDLHRTFYTHVMFRVEGGKGQQELFRILATYARYNQKTGYCQGMAYIAAVLLMHMSEEDAFWSFVCLMGSPFYLEGFYNDHLARTQHESEVFTVLLAQQFPNLARHLNKLSLHPLMYVTQWYMCAFTSLPLWDTVLSIWDMMMLKGTKSFYQVALCIMTVSANSLLQMTNIATALPFLHHLPSHKIVRRMFMREVWRIDEVKLHDEIRKIEDAVSCSTSFEELYNNALSTAHEVASHNGVEEQIVQNCPRNEESPPIPPPNTLFQRIFLKLTTPSRHQASAEKSCKSQAEHLLSESPQKSPFSPSFHRAGLLSPSFKPPGDFSPPLEPDRYTLPSILLSPGDVERTFELDSPTTVESFRSIVMKTPLRASQLSIPQLHLEGQEKLPHSRSKKQILLSTPPTNSASPALATTRVVLESSQKATAHTSGAKNTDKVYNEIFSNTTSPLRRSNVALLSHKPLNQEKRCSGTPLQTVTNSCKIVDTSGRTP